MRERGLTERLVMVSPGDGAPFDHGLWEIVVEPARPELPTIDTWEPSRPRARRALKVLG
jgi:hypothetical protein